MQFRGVERGQVWDKKEFSFDLAKILGEFSHLENGENPIEKVFKQISVIQDSESRLGTPTQKFKQ